MTKRKTAAAAKAPAPTEAPAATTFRKTRDAIRATRGRQRLAAEELEAAERFLSASEERLTEGRESAAEQCDRAETRIRRAKSELRVLKAREDQQLRDAVPHAVAYRDALILGKQTSRHGLALRVSEAIEAARTALLDALGKGEPIDPALLPVAALRVDPADYAPKPLGPFDDLDAWGFGASEVRIHQRAPKRDPLTALSRVLRDELKVPLASALGTVARLSGVSHDAVRAETFVYGASDDDMTLVVRLDTTDDAELVKAARVILAAATPATATAA